MTQTAAPQGESGQPLKNKPVDTHHPTYAARGSAAARRDRRAGAILQLGGRRRLAALADDPHPRRAGHLPRHGRRDRTAHAPFHRGRAALDRLRIPPRAVENPVRHAPRELPLERAGDVAAQARGVPHLARNRQLLDAVVQAARGARIPPRRAVQQPQPRRHQGVELRARTAGFDRGTAAAAHLAHRRRRRADGDADVVVRPCAATVVHHGVPRPRRRRAQPPQHRPLVLRLVPHQRARSLPPGLPDRRLRRHALPREHLGQGGVVRGPQPLHDLHHLDRAEKILSHRRGYALRRDVRRAELLLERPARPAQFVALSLGGAGGELHDLCLSAGRRRAAGPRAQNRLRPPDALRYDRHGVGTRTRRGLHGQRLHAAGLRRRAGLVDGVPAFDALRAAGQLAALLHGSRPRQAQSRARAAPCALPHADRPRAGMGRILARRAFRRHGRGGCATLGGSGADRTARTGVGRPHRAALLPGHRRFGHVARPHRTRRDGHSSDRRGLHHAERPHGPRRAALFRINRFGLRRGALLRPGHGASVPALDLDLRLVRRRPTARATC